MQERLDGPHYAWKMLTACVLLNRTHGRVAREVIFGLLDECTTPRMLLDMPAYVLLGKIKRLGLSNRRTSTLRALADACARGCEVGTLPGIGPYGLYSYALFVEGRLPTHPSNDGKLRRYCKWLKSLSKEARLRVLGLNRRRASS